MDPNRYAQRTWAARDSGDVPGIALVMSPLPAAWKTNRPGVSARPFTAPNATQPKAANATSKARKRTGVSQDLSGRCLRIAGTVSPMAAKYSPP